MTSASYAFLDIAVLDEVRERFAAGDALAILNTGLNEILWANGTGAAWLGYTEIEAAIGNKPLLPAVALRQIAGAPSFPRMGREQTLALRLTSGLRSRIVTLQASGMTLPQGEPAVLLTIPAGAESDTPAERASRVIKGFDQPGHFAAFIDAEGNVAAASAGFDTLALDPDSVKELVREVRQEEDRLIKRRIRGARALPAGIARLTDEPATHLLVVVDEGTAPEEMPAPAEQSHAPLTTPTQVVTAKDEPGERDLSRPQNGTDTPETPPAAAVQKDMAARPEREAAPVELSKPRTVRFSWRTDAEGRFSAISDEFAMAVGEPAADVIGRSFREVSNAFGLDASGSISRLLERRDTWSGRTVMWPLSGTALKVPVDLAALPVYGRGRVFEGFRGFGIVRLGEAEADEEAIGTVLVNPPPEVQQDASAEELTENGTVEEPVPNAEEMVDPFLGEKPAISISTRSEESPGSKVVQLSERRETTREGLTASERTAFREIGERLRRANVALIARTDKQDGGTPHQGPAELMEDGAQEEPTFTGDTPFLGEVSPAKARLEPEAPAESSASRQATESARPEHHQGAGAKHEADPETANADTRMDPANENADGREEAGAADLEPASRTEEIEEAGPVALEQADDEPKARTRKAEPAAAEQHREEETRQEAGGGNAKLQGESDPTEDRLPKEDDAADSSIMRGGSGTATSSMPEHFDEGSREESGGQTATSTFSQVEPKAPGIVHSREEEDSQGTPARRSANMAFPSAFYIPARAREEAVADATSVLSSLPLPILIHAGDTLHYANREFLKLTGYADLDALEAVGGIGALFAEQNEVASGTAPEGTLHLRTAEGADVPVEAHLQSMAWEGGKALMLALRPASHGTVQSLTAEQDARDANELAERLVEMRAIVDTATDGIAVIANDGTIRSINSPAEALFGFDVEHLTGKPFSSLFAVESQRTVQDYLAALSDNGVASVLNDGRQVIGREAQGRFIPLFITIGRLPGDRGFCAVLRDITNWKRVEEELTQARAQAERASSQKSDFLARVSHEIRTPLNAIIGFSELMMDERFGPIGNERYRDYLRDINRSGTHVLDLVNDLLDISKIEAGQQEIEYEAVSLNETLGQIVAMMQPQANSERIIIRSSFASNIPDVVADLRSVRQIALNLLSNAVRYTPAGGQVIVSTAYEPDGSVVIRVRDTGIGMSSAELDEALKPFKQINTLRRKRGDGTGLGLPLTRAMVEANRAQFSISSTPGVGTLVEVTFPPTRVLAD